MDKLWLFFFIDSEDGQCYLFNENGKIDDVKKITTLYEEYIKKDIKKIAIPESVKIIGEWAFYSTSLKSIKIPKSINSVEILAFSHCYSLTSIEIPDRVESIGYGAFGNCISLTSIEIPDSVKSIGDMAFYNCMSLEKVIFKCRTMDQVMAMENYSWGIEDESIIKCQKS